MILRLARVAALSALLVGVFVVPASAQGADQDAVKARMSVLLLDFVRWPDDAPDEEASDFLFCSLGDTDIGDYWIQGTPAQVGGRPVRVERRSAIPGLETCDVLYLGPDEEANLPAVFARVEGEGVLTISDIPGFAQAGGVVGFFWRGNRPRLAVNPAAAERMGVRVTARLLELAEIVGADQEDADAGVRP